MPSSDGFREEPRSTPVIKLLRSRRETPARPSRAWRPRCRRRGPCRRARRPSGAGLPIGRARIDRGSMASGPSTGLANDADVTAEGFAVAAALRAAADVKPAVHQVLATLGYGDAIG